VDAGADVGAIGDRAGMLLLSRSPHGRTSAVKSIDGRGQDEDGSTKKKWQHETRWSKSRRRRAVPCRSTCMPRMHVAAHACSECHVDAWRRGRDEETLIGRGEDVGTGRQWCKDGASDEVSLLSVSARVPGICDSMM
jgi:hypothetical protein